MGKDTGFFNEIKQRVPLEDYLQDVLQVELISDGAGRLKGCCPFHSEASPSFKVMTDEDPQRWWCFGSCSTGGSVIDAVIMANGGEGVMTAVEAAMWLNDYYDLGLEVNSEEWQRFRANVEETRETIKEAQENLEGESREAQIARAYLEKRGFTSDTIANFRLGVDTSITKSGRVSIPLVDKANHEISVDGRSLFDGANCRTCQKWVTAKEMSSRRDKWNSAQKSGRELPFTDWRECPHCTADATAAGIAWVAGQHPKYRFKGGYEKSRHLYNHFGAKRALVDDAKLMREHSDQKLHGIYVCEGYADVWSCWQAGQHAVCAYNGSQMSEVQAAALVELAHQFDRPIILVPDFDKAGRNNVENNVARLRAVDETIEIHVLTGVDQFEFTDPNTQERKECKDVGDVLQYHGTTAVIELLDRNRRPVEDWLIRMVLDARSERTGVPFYTKDQQLTRVAGILRQVHHRHSLDYLVPVLADAWKMGEDQARSFFYSALSDDELTSMSHLIGTIEEAQADALDFILNSRLIPTGYARIDKAIGGGARRGWLCMMLGKSLALDAPVLTPAGWRANGELKAGDSVTDPAGGTATIIGVFPQGERALFRLIFDGGVASESDLEHLWFFREADTHTEHVETLSEIQKTWIERGVEIPRLAGDGWVWHRLELIEFSRRAEAQCIRLDSANQLFVTHDNLITHNSGTGKALAEDEPVLTPSGWVPIGQLRVGDEVVDPAGGGVTTVAGVYPQGERQLYRATFSDGTSVECDGDHLWEVQQPGQESQVRTTLEIKERIERGGYHTHHRIPLTSPVELRSDEEQPISPYLLGTLLGDGSIAAGSVRLTTIDQEVVDRVTRLLPAGMRLQPYSDKEFGIVGAGPGANSLLTHLRDIGLWGTRSHDKFVPHQYKFASAEDRLDLLRGLMDTDGTVGVKTYEHSDKTSRIVEFCSTSEQLADDVAFLVRSLGGIAQIKTSPAGYRVDDGTRVACKDRHRVHIALPQDVNPFRLKSKADLFVRYQQPRKRFVSIEPSRKAKAVCIRVSSEAALFITRDFIVTHNTMWCLQTLANMAAHGTRSIFFSLEQKKGQLFERMTQQVLGVDGDQARLLIKENHESLAEVRELFKNLRIVDNVPTATQEAVEMTAGRVQSIIRETNMMHFEGAPCDVVVIDHLGILKVGKDAPRAIQSDPLQAAGYIMEQMFAVCKAANVFMIVLQQLPKEIKAGVEIEFDAGRGGSAQTDFCDIILTAWRPELEAGIDEAERLNRKGQYKLKASKNRYGPSVTEHMMFDNRCLRIVPTDAIAMPTDDISETPRVQIEGLDLDDAPQLAVEAPAVATATAVLEAPVATADLKETAELLGLVEDDEGSSEAADEFDDWLRD